MIGCFISLVLAAFIAVVILWAVNNPAVALADAEHAISAATTWLSHLAQSAKQNPGLGPAGTGSK
jgi:hypothetical protein